MVVPPWVFRDLLSKSDEGSRQSIWTFPVDWGNLFYVAFYVLAAFSAWVAIANVCDSQPDAGPWAKTQAIGTGFSSLMVGSAVLALFLTEVVRMISDVIIESFKKRRYNRGLIDQHRLWEEWNQRREAAQGQGMDFTEPPPEVPQSTSLGAGSGRMPDSHPRSAKVVR